MSKLHEFTPALIVVDMQYDFVYGSLAVPDAPSIIGIVNSMIDLPFAAKIGTKDYHPPDHISFASTHAKPLFSKITIYPPGGKKDKSRALGQILWPDHCVASSPGSEFVKDLRSQELDAVVHKGTHRDVESYSAFHDPWRITMTELPKLLAGRGITDVYICGLAGDYCVKYSALDAVKLGYRTWVVRDAVRSVSDAGVEWGEMEANGVRVIKCDDVRRRMERQTKLG
ncbi:hypothetical protein AMATHDRAFT_140362 [Amanita thiersii Skay4041]|uniref:nicotinamidase n=1 Tax=Amanita thiersii Skay4041 TaxID=703135 RepID=A0A2A9NVG6_9AGAR|nr:hypothetical protein AMATHDRAFT_140362 [Amanita thiersii Skay4041]